eukprot:3230821-Alexandrium_andersonii.AAC.1
MCIRDSCSPVQFTVPLGRMRGLESARSRTPSSLGASALGGPRVEGLARAGCAPSSTGPPRGRRSR